MKQREGRSVGSHRVFDFVFTADLHSQEGRNIAAAARAQLRPGEIDNERKDTIGRGTVGSLRISISRNDHHEWVVGARSTDDEYDRERAAALREAVLAALQENAEKFEELPSELNPAG